MPVEQDYEGEHKADVHVLSSAAVSDIHNLWRHIEFMLKHKQEGEMEHSIGSAFCQYQSGCIEIDMGTLILRWLKMRLLPVVSNPSCLPEERDNKL